jgi:exopolysaccharide biosynthesis WecB/TagA/CpsF family protein
MGLPRWESGSGADELARSGERESFLRVKSGREPELDAARLPAMDVFGVLVATCGFEDLRGWFLAATEHRGRFPKVMLFAGTRSFAQATRDCEHATRLRRADVVLGEGAGVTAYAKLAAAPMRERFDAVATLDRLFAATDPHRPLRVFVCGEDRRCAERAATGIAARFPGIEIVGAAEARRHSTSLSEDVNEACADVVLVAMDDGRAEAWIEENLCLLDVGVVVGAGSALEAFAGELRAKARPLGVLAMIAFFVRATLYLAFPARRAMPPSAS